MFAIAKAASKPEIIPQIIFKYGLNVIFTQLSAVTDQELSVQTFLSCSNMKEKKPIHSLYALTEIYKKYFLLY